MTSGEFDAARLPRSARVMLDEFAASFSWEIRVRDSASGQLMYPETADVPAGEPDRMLTRRLRTREGASLELAVHPAASSAAPVADLLCAQLVRLLDADREIRFLSGELSERYEEINLLYSISEILGSILELGEAARIILKEVCDVLGARRGSLWVYDPADGLLRQVAAEGIAGLDGPLDPAGDLLTARVFREKRAIISPGGETNHPPAAANLRSESALSVPIQYAPQAGVARTVGVINLFGRRGSGVFSAGDRKLLSAIASQIGAALENHRLFRESRARDRMAHEMELAHNLQMRLLQPVDQLGLSHVAARVQPAEQVGGDFYHFIKLSGGRLGVMIGDVSSHGFPAALIMALALSAASIFAGEVESPAEVLRHVDDALRDELETTEMYLTLFCGVLDPAAGELVYSNAGHPHAFIFRKGEKEQRLSATDPPVGIAGPGSYSEASVSWGAGEDLLFLFTDGLSDSLATTGSLSGERAVLAEARNQVERGPSAIVDSLFRLAAEPTQAMIPADDRTAIALRF